MRRHGIHIISHHYHFTILLSVTVIFCRMTNYQVLQWLVKKQSRDIHHYQMCSDEVLSRYVSCLETVSRHGFHVSVTAQSQHLYVLSYNVFSRTLNLLNQSCLTTVSWLHHCKCAVMIPGHCNERQVAFICETTIGTTYTCIHKRSPHKWQNSDVDKSRILDPQLVWSWVSRSITSHFNTNMATPETKGQGWRVILTQWRKASDISLL